MRNIAICYFLMTALSLPSQAGGSAFAVTDTVNIPKLVVPDENGNIDLRARHGYATGDKIAYMPEWDAFGYFNETGRIEWNVKVEQAGKYDVILEWSATGDVVDNPYVFEVETGKKVKGRVEESGSWETFRSKKIGSIRLRRGLQRMVFRPHPSLKKGGMLDLRVIQLVLRD